MTNTEMINYINDNIVQINNKITDFKKTTPNDTEIKNFLKKKFHSDIESDELKRTLIKELNTHNFVKARINDIANKYVYYNKDLKDFYEDYVYKYILNDIDDDSLSNNILDFIKKDTSNPDAFKFINNDLTKLVHKLLCLLKIKGFSTNLLGINDGIMLANSGDSAQFLFLSRAILAGFNCSNVDVRSSRYDAIIDYNNTLLRVQIKGVTNDVISFKDRDRGGQGIDHTHDRNKGKIITSEDCDIYVAVDKQCGLCYIIPMKTFVDPLDDDSKKKMKTSDIEQFKENWDIVKEVAYSLED